MTHFEYLAVSVSLAMAIAMARLISGLPYAFIRDRRYWLHSAWLGLWLWELVRGWWFIWSYREVDWTFAKFLVLLAPAAPILFIAYTLVPDNAELVDSWRQHFYRVRRRFLGAAIVFFLSLLLIQSALQSLPILEIRRIVPSIALAAGIAGLMTSRPPLQAAVFSVVAGMEFIILAGELLGGLARR